MTATLDREQENGHNGYDRYDHYLSTGHKCYDRVVITVMTASLYSDTISGHNCYDHTVITVMTALPMSNLSKFDLFFFLYNGVSIFKI